MLSSIRDFMQGRPTANISEIALHLDSSPEAVRGMIGIWERKGRMIKLPLPCGNCTQCDTGTTEIYQWIDNGSALGRESAVLTLAPAPSACTVLPA